MLPDYHVEHTFKEGYALGTTHGNDKARVLALAELAIVVKNLMVEKEFPIALAVNGTLVELYEQMSEILLKVGPDYD